MGLGKTDLLEDDKGGVIGDGRLSFIASTSVSCSICLDAVTDNGDRSTAKLQCGHEFHLDCIGSAFNAKGMMQCPNCRKIEKGQWLYANGYRSFPESSMDDWTYDEDLYDLSYSEVPFDVHWCPFGLTRLASLFGDGESPSNSYHELFGHHAIFAEHMTASSTATHSCPYVSYFQSIQPLSSANSSESSDGPSFHHHWSGLSRPSDISTSHAFPAADFHYHNWENHSSPFSLNSGRIDGADHSSNSTVHRSTMSNLDGVLRAGLFMPPFPHGSASRAGSSVISSMPPSYLGNSRAPARVQGHHSYHQQPNLSGTRGPMFSGGRRSGPRSLAPAGSAPSSADRGGFYYYPSSGSSVPNLREADNTIGNHFYAWERDRFAPYPLVPVDRESSLWGPFHQSASGSDSGSGAGLWHRHGSERPSSGGRTESSPYQCDTTRTHQFF